VSDTVIGHRFAQRYRPAISRILVLTGAGYAASKSMHRGDMRAGRRRRRDQRQLWVECGSTATSACACVTKSHRQARPAANT
jgi:hypothetical protein